MAWFIFSLLSVFALASAELTQQHLLNLKNPLSPRASAVLTFLFQSVLMLPVVLFSPLKEEVFNIFRPDLIPLVFAVTLIASVGMIFYLKSFQVKNISFSSIFGSCSVLVSTFLGIVFFQESTSVLKFLGILLILLAIVSLNLKNAHLEKNHFFALASGIMFGVAYSLDKAIVLSVSPVVYIFWAFLLVSLFGFLFSPRHIINSVRGRNLKVFIPVIVSGVGYFLYNFFTFNSYRVGGEVGRVDAINNSQVFLIILFEFFILKHTSSVFRKILTAIIAYSGIVILGIVK